ncbi:hypothetical protein LZ30DRAFT_734768 [Colletotrichum cereale]|nr:hypothetical protein LZ30DRAFT_734768 [Colletotrichum cereale]
MFLLAQIFKTSLIQTLLSINSFKKVTKSTMKAAFITSLVLSAMGLQVLAAQAPNNCEKGCQTFCANKGMTADPGSCVNGVAVQCNCSRGARR